MAEFSHRTVLLAETVQLLEPKAGKLIIDGTLGGGGHAKALLQAGATVIGIDRDPAALAAASARLSSFPGFTARQGDYASFEGPCDGLLLDLGVSSPQLDDPSRGFSFQTDGPLDMRMSGEGQTAAELIAELGEEDLANTIYQLGEERFSRRIAKQLKALLPKTTLEAVEAIKRAVPRKAWGSIHVATRTFQALRIAVNRELEQLQQALAKLPSALKPGGIAAIISFHSLEDRLVKHAFRETLEPLTKKPVTASDEEIAANPRARSAKLRAARRLT